MPKKTDWSSADFQELDHTALVDSKELSRRLVYYVAWMLSKGSVPATQSDVGAELDIGQSMVHQVLYKGKAFSQSVFRDYAERLARSPHSRIRDSNDLVCELLAIGKRESLDETGKHTLSSPCNVKEAIADLFLATQREMSLERKQERSDDGLVGFDYKCWFGEALRFLIKASEICDTKIVSAIAVVADGDRCEAMRSSVGVFANSLAHTEEPQVGVAKLSDLVVALLSRIDDTPGHQVMPDDGVRSENAKGSSFDREFRKCLDDSASFGFLASCLDGGSSIRIRKQDVYSRQNCRTTNMSVSLVTLSLNDRAQPTSDFLDSLSLASLLIERTALFAATDRADAFIANCQVEQRTFFQASRQEAYEACVQSMLDRIEDIDSAGLIASADVWVHSGAPLGYISPQPFFQRVFEPYKLLQVEAKGGTISFEDAYASELAGGSLKPSESGKTNYMRSHKCGVAISRHDNPLKASWASRTPVDIGTLLGVPIDFVTASNSETCPAALYVRFSRDLSPEEKTHYFALLVSALGSDRCATTSLRARLGAPDVKEASLAAEYRCDDEHGCWYDLEVSPTSFDI